MKEHGHPMVEGRNVIMVVTLMIKVTSVQVYTPTALLLGELAALFIVLLEKFDMIDCYKVIT